MTFTCGNKVADRRMRQRSRSMLFRKPRKYPGAVWRCLRGASRSVRSISPMAPLNASSRGAVRTRTLRSGGSACDTTSRTVRRPTPGSSPGALVLAYLPPRLDCTPETLTPTAEDSC